MNLPWKNNFPVGSKIFPKPYLFPSAKSPIYIDPSGFSSDPNPFFMVFKGSMLWSVVFECAEEEEVEDCKLDGDDGRFGIISD